MNKQCPITGLTTAERTVLSHTIGHPVYADYVLRHEASLKKQEPTYDLDFDAITEEFETALAIGLENYGSGKACWELCRIVKGNNNMNKLASLWQLYCSEVAQQYVTRDVNRAWQGYTDEQREYITKHLTNYLCDFVEYLQSEFD